jgi:very-short-patch-repair endonuclease/KaiC/GvpD/RAD55 family RecA-like ATPase
MSPQKKSAHKRRQVPWPKIVAFHKEIAERNEEGFFAKRTDDDQARDWSFVRDFQPLDMSGSWKFEATALISEPFGKSLAGDQHEALFGGGPGYCASKQKFNTRERDDYWNPVFYRQLAHRKNEGTLELVPDAGKWYLSPTFVATVERLQLTLRRNIEELAEEVLEEAKKEFDSNGKPLGRAIKEVFCRMEPDLRPIFNKTFKLHPSGAPTDWAVFAPVSSFSPLNRHLMNDYLRLEKTLDGDPSVTGGLECLEDLPYPKTSSSSPPIPIVPLNEKQEMAVSAILEDRPVTVVSGPPGCGKSQVVVSLLLNAWAEGKSVLFASNNNKAVNVVLERLEQFESDFPVAVRAGNKKESRVVDTMRRILNMAADAQEDSSMLTSRAERRQVEIDELRETLNKTKKALDSGMPARITETLKTALSANAEEMEIRSTIERTRSALEKSRPATKKTSKKALRKTLEEMDSWWDRMDDFRELAEADARKRRECQEQLEEAEKAVRECAAKGGMETEEIPDWDWLENPCPEELKEWTKSSIEKMQADVVPNLQEKPEEYWKEEFNEWKSEEEAEAFGSSARTTERNIASAVDGHRNSLPKMLEERRSNLRKWKDIVGKLSEILSMEESQTQAILDGMESGHVSLFSKWLGIYADRVTSTQPAWWNLPGKLSMFKLTKSLEECEAEMFPLFPNEIRLAIGQLSWEARAKWNAVVESTKEWFLWKQLYESNEKEIAEVENSLSEFHDVAAEYEWDGDKLDLDSWKKLAGEIGKRAKTAEEAAVAWKKYALWYDAEKELKRIGDAFEGNHSDAPLWRAWLKGQGGEIVSRIEQAKEDLGGKSAAELLEFLKSGPEEPFAEAWLDARSWNEKSRRIADEIDDVPEEKSRVREWWKSRGPKVKTEEDCPAEWPKEDCHAFAVKSRIREWLDKWEKFEDVEMPELNERMAEEAKRAEQNLTAVLELARETGYDEATQAFVREAMSIRGEALPAHDIQNALSSFTEQSLGSLLNKTQSKLKNLSFEHAKDQWLLRLSEDDEAMRAVHELVGIYERNRDELTEKDYGLFESALRAAPIWITSAASTHSIPMVPGGFDLVVVDEATQCSITNLLPLLFRGKRLAVIGDENQLRAIPNVSATEENLLAKKHDVEDWVGIFGHCGQDVYTAGVESIPKRTAGVVTLREHYRSHPQIIGFANRDVYRGRLELRRPLKGFKEEDGVHAVQVSGQAERGKRNDSWQNRAEASKIVDLITSNPGVMTGGKTAGVVTPFRAQSFLIGELLVAKGLTIQVLVGNAHVFQGDERDVVYFSPVVAPGMSENTANWVGRPPNLVNVAVTRARDSLYVVGDLDGISGQTGILGRLAKYAKTVEKLRDKKRDGYSPCELAMFSLMCAEGWQPDIQVQIKDIWVDFVLKCDNGQQLVVETDGEEHHERKKEQDDARDAFLRAKGYLVKRIPCRDVFDKPTDTIARIREIIEKES